MSEEGMRENRQTKEEREEYLKWLWEREKDSLLFKWIIIMAAIGLTWLLKKESLYNVRFYVGFFIFGFFNFLTFVSLCLRYKEKVPSWVGGISYLSFIWDLAFISFAIYWTGGQESNFYLLLFVMAVRCAYFYQPLKITITLGEGIGSLAFVFPVLLVERGAFPLMDKIFWIRLSIFWVAGLLSNSFVTTLKVQSNEIKRWNKTLEKRVAERTRELEVAYEKSIHDGLTGLYTHNFFQNYLEQAISKAKRYGTPLSLLMLDIDYFKKFNDTYGHPAGDRVLVNIARLLKEALREADIAARYGGEEFILVLPETDDRRAYLLAERLRKNVQAFDFLRGKEKGVEITISIGVAGYGKGMHREVLISQADQALYRAKKEGRNKVCVFRRELRSI